MTETPTPTLNGTAEHQVAPGRLPQGALRRLMRLSAQAELGQAVAQQTAARWNEALAEACGDAGIELPQGNLDVRVDWRSGEVHFAHAQPGAD